MEQSERPVCLEDAVDLHEVLHRDQRTVRVRVAVDAPRAAAPRRQRRVARPPSECEQCQLVRQGVQPVCDLSVPQYRICHRHTTSSSRSRSRSSSSWFPVGSVIRWLLTALCVLALLPPRAMAAPTRTQPKWINPCNLSKQQPGEPDELLDNDTVSIADQLQRIVSVAEAALHLTSEFSKEYVNVTFQTEYENHHRNWQIQRYDWLPSIPKKLGERVGEEHLRAQTMDVALKDIYKYLQQYAVGLEQVVIDQKASDGTFKRKFEFAEVQLSNILCDLQFLMQEQGVVQHPDVSADIMAPVFRNMDPTYRNVRDWIILRDYINGLEYLTQVLDFLSKKTQN